MSNCATGGSRFDAGDFRQGIYPRYKALEYTARRKCARWEVRRAFLDDVGAGWKIVSRSPVDRNFFRPWRRLGQEVAVPDRITLSEGELETAPQSVVLQRGATTPMVFADRCDSIALKEYLDASLSFQKG